MPIDSDVFCFGGVLVKRLLLLAAAGAVLSSACSSSSTGPTRPSDPPAVNVSGAWTGVMSYTQITNGTSASRAENVSLTLIQAGSSVSGRWATAIRNGTVTGTTTATEFSGTFTYNTTSSTGAACVGTFNVSGGAGGSTMTWTSPTVVENCSGPPDSITFALHR